MFAIKRVYTTQIFTNLADNLVSTVLVAECNP